MNPRVEEVFPLENYRLKLIFSNGEVKLFDTNPYLEFGVFRELRDEELFRTVRTNLGSISWKNGQDLCPDTLYIASVPVK